MEEKALWAAVINQALVDASAYLDYTARRRHTLPNNTSYSEVSQSWEFLTARHGEWARSRMDICDQAGIDPDMLRSRVLEVAAEGGNLSGLFCHDLQGKAGEARRLSATAVAAE